MGGVDLRSAVGAITPHGLVRSRRWAGDLRRFGTSARGRRAWEALVEARLDLLPPRACPALLTVVDVGANEGRWTAALLDVAAPELVRAVEPSPTIAAGLRARFAPRPEVEVVEAAIGAEQGEATLHVTAHSHNTSLLDPKTAEMDAVYGGGYQTVEDLTVAVTTLDRLCHDLPEVSLLKLDVQGAEGEALNGADQVLDRVRWLLVEANFVHHYDGDLLFPELHGQLAGRGFVLTGMSPPSIRSGRATWTDALYERA